MKRPPPQVEVKLVFEKGFPDESWLEFLAELIAKKVLEEERAKREPVREPKTEPPSRHATGDVVLRRRQVLERVGVSAATLHRWMANGRFPSSIRLGPRRVGWRKSEIDAWVRERAHS